MSLSSFPRHLARRSAAAFLAPLALAACPKVPTQTASMQAAPNVDVTADQLQVQVYSMGQRFSSMLAMAADSISSVSGDPLVQRRALRWKLAATPLVQEASLRDDPLVAAVDLAAFSQ
jgi:type II secretory pathway component HofQ